MRRCLGALVALLTLAGVLTFASALRPEVASAASVSSGLPTGHADWEPFQPLIVCRMNVNGSTHAWAMRCNYGGSDVSGLELGCFAFKTPLAYSPNGITFGGAGCITLPDTTSMWAWDARSGTIGGGGCFTVGRSGVTVGSPVGGGGCAAVCGISTLGCPAIVPTYVTGTPAIPDPVYPVYCSDCALTTVTIPPISIPSGSPSTTLPPGATGPVPCPVGTYLTVPQLRDLVYEVALSDYGITLTFGEAFNFVSIALAESGLNVNAVGDGGDSIGLFQINGPAHPGYANAQRYDPRYNTSAAIDIWNSAGGQGAGVSAWHAWSVWWWIDANHDGVVDSGEDVGDGNGPAATAGGVVASHDNDGSALDFYAVADPLSCGTTGTTGEEEGCGSWTAFRIDCWIKKALIFLFVPDDSSISNLTDAFSTIWNDKFPFGLLSGAFGVATSFVSIPGNVLAHQDDCYDLWPNGAGFATVFGAPAGAGEVEDLCPSGLTDEVPQWAYVRGIFVAFMGAHMVFAAINIVRRMMGKSVPVPLPTGPMAENIGGPGLDGYGGTMLYEEGGLDGTGGRR